MAERFSAFSFVDRITRLDPGARIEGRYSVPRAATRFPASLMAEAVGQLAAWAAMSQAGFARRPVAGLAAETLYFGAAAPGQTLALEADIQSCDAEAIAYGGKAHVDGACVLELRNCVGPMLPMEEFDAPEAVRADFETLRGPGAPADRFRGVDAPEVRVVEHVAGEHLRAELLVPAAAPFFDDHFPRRPVFPGTLLLDSQAELALRLAREAAPLRAAQRLAATRVTDVKIRAFTPPGQVLELRAELMAASAEGARVNVAARADGKAVATARIEIAPRRAA
jgi:3-hydroxymyristoyl/3-hydroxydecanoyl-(acyl carrier protein) dehydratase